MPALVLTWAPSPSRMQPGRQGSLRSAGCGPRPSTPSRPTRMQLGPGRELTVRTHNGPALSPKRLESGPHDLVTPEGPHLLVPSHGLGVGLQHWGPVRAVGWGQKERGKIQACDLGGPSRTRWGPDSAVELVSSPPGCRRGALPVPVALRLLGAAGPPWVGPRPAGKPPRGPGHPRPGVLAPPLSSHGQKKKECLGDLCVRI